MCWRACVVWQNRRAVWAVCGSFLLATFSTCTAAANLRPSDAVSVPGVMNATSSCNLCLSVSQNHFNVPIVGAQYTGFPAGIAAAVLSLATNFLATFLVGCKAWCVVTPFLPKYCARKTDTPHLLVRESRKRLHGYFVGGSVASQVEKLFALLVESGAIYCALWASLLFRVPLIPLIQPS